MNPNLQLGLYLLFVASWFLHLGSRVPFLGLIRFDLILIVVLAFAAIASKALLGTPLRETDRYLRVLAVYAVLTVPFVQWPGSVIQAGIPNFVKGIVFFYFTLAFVRSEADLRKLVMVFLACQLFRVMEPLYLHVTEGYWGAVAYMSGGAEALERLSGAPDDVVNPNGLAFIICTVLPFLYFLAGPRWSVRVAFAILGAACIYALLLTGSRSGLVGMAIVFLGIVVKSRGTRRFALAFAGIFALVLAFPYLSADLQDRYLSLVGLGVKNAATADGRLEGIQENFSVALRRPLFGHGLGTSREANANFARMDQPAHNLYAEVATELGFVGLAIWLLFMKSIVTDLVKCATAYRHRSRNAYAPRLSDAVQVWLAMNLIFSFASYGLSSYEWYLLGGLTVVLRRLAGRRVPGGVRPLVYAPGRPAA